MWIFVMMFCAWFTFKFTGVHLTKQGNFYQINTHFNPNAALKHLSKGQEKIRCFSSGLICIQIAC